jgi:hypothetical protein
MEDRVTFVLTSCGRIDLLERTITSFLNHNNYPIDKYFLIDDSGKETIFDDIVNLNQKLGNIFELHFNYEKIGQVRSIDKIYSFVDTKYIFHCEDDWEFYKSGFIQKSIDVLKFDDKILQVIIRRKNNDSYITQFSNSFTQINKEVKYRKVVPISYTVGTHHISNYGGFTLNPGLRRLSDYKLLSSYTSISDPIRGCEEFIDIFYKQMGYYVVTICENDEDGYVYHIGWGRHSENTIL